MDNVRLILWFSALAFAWLSYTAWLEDYTPAAEPAPVATDGAAPEQSLPDLTPSTAVAEESESPPQIAAEVALPANIVRIRTDVLDLAINPVGGDLIRADLLEYPVDKSQPDEVVRLLDFTPEQRWIFQTGLRNAAEGDEPNHLAEFSSAAPSYELAAGADELSVVLEWVTSGAVAARKIYTLRRGRYEIDLDIELENRGPSAWQGAAYSQMIRVHEPEERSFTSVDSYSFTGPVLYDGDRYEKLDVEDLLTDPVTQTLANGWFAGIQHHFLAAAVPPGGDATSYRAAARGREYVLTAVGPVATVEPGASFNYALKLFVGPKLQDQLRATSEELDLTVDYGGLTVLAQPLFWLLSWIFGWVRNWGWAIIIMTILIKLAFYKLTATSGRSMAKMRKIAPRMKALQERYKDDRQGLNQAMMDLYKREKVNPAAGCLPVLVQMPFFFAFYWVLIESVEMRQAPFMLWIQDLSVRDPYFILPLLMGAAMFLQTRLNPAPPDPVQAKVMLIIPLVFTVFFAFFPAGLVLYWLTNTVVQMLQQWRINTLVERENKAAA